MSTLLSIHRTMSIQLAALVASVTCAATPTFAQCALELVIPPTGAAALQFSRAYALHDDLVVVGAYAEHVGAAQNSGAAYAYPRGPHGLGPGQRLVPFVAAENLRFGTTVATDGQRVLVSTGPSATGSSGVHVFAPSGNGLALEQVLPPLVLSPVDYGHSLAIAGDRLAVRSNTGDIDLYERISGVWTLVTTLQKANGGEYMATCRMLFHGPRLYVYRDRWTNVDNHIEVWRRTPQGWIFETRLIGRWTVSQSIGFGSSLAVRGDRLAIGEPDWAGWGRVLIYDRVGAVIGQSGSFEAPEARRLGAEVAFDGPRIVASEPTFQGATGRGAIGIYEDQMFGWTEVVRHERPATLLATIDWIPSTLMGTDFLAEAELPMPGTSITLDVLALVELTPRPDLRFCPATVNSTGVPGRIEVEGTRSVAALDTALVARDLSSFSFVLFVYGPREGTLPLGNGTLCVDPLGGGLVRVNPPVLADVAGYARTPFLPANAPSSAPLEAGRSYVFQAWYRDVAGGGALFNLTDALRVTFCP